MNSSGTFGLFSVPMYKGEVKNYRKVNKELLSLYKELEFDHMDGWITNTQKLNRNAFGSSIISNAPLFHEALNVHLKKYLDDVGTLDIQMGDVHSRQYNIKNSWITQTTKNQFAHLHSHGDSDISGVYYIKTTGKDGNIYFHSPMEVLASNYIIGSLQSVVEVPPAEGCLLLWPSFLLHGVRQNTTDSERISLSFNLNFIRDGFTFRTN